MIDRTRSQGQSLYVGFVDISNAFPSADRSLLWIKLRRMGFSGRLVDWLRMLYERMNYVVELGDAVSDTFQSDVGVLIGDPASPTLWNLFMSDFRLPRHQDDASLNGVAIAHIEHADDMALMSVTPEGMQHHLAYFFEWCKDNYLVVIAIKS